MTMCTDGGCGFCGACIMEREGCTYDEGWEIYELENKGGMPYEAAKKQVIGNKPQACGMGYPSLGLPCVRPPDHGFSDCFALKRKDGRLWGVYMQQDGKDWVSDPTQWPDDIADRTLLEGQAETAPPASSCPSKCRTVTKEVRSEYCRNCKERHKQYANMHKRGPSGMTPLEAFELCREVIGNMQRDPETRELLDKLIERGKETPKPPTGRRAAIEHTKRKKAADANRTE